VTNQPRWAAVTLVTLAAFLPVAAGCTSNEYVIPHDELARLAATPPAQRGARVRVVQELGERRADRVPVVEPTYGPPPPPPEPIADEETGPGIQVNVSGGCSHGSGGGHLGGGHSGGGHSGGGHSGGGHSGGGGGGDGDAALVVLIVVVAVVIAVGLVSSEGVRFDGFVAMSPAQPIHLRAADGGEATVPVGALSSDLVAETVEAKVMDDEGDGLRLLDEVPLDRRGGAFKLDSGTIAFGVPGGTVFGPALDVQFGVFVTRRVGLLGSLGLAGGSAGGGGGLIPRHALALELQVLPWGAGRFHLGLFGNGGMALSEKIDAGQISTVEGPAVGGGALAEMDLTPRMALTLRAGANLAKLDQRWTPAGLLTAGVAVY
jgi:hypothetical protein